MTEQHNPAPVTVIGLGPMGQEMVRTFLAHGHRTTVWNRTPSRADALVEQGALRAGTAADAVAANELIVLSLTDYQAMYDILEPVGDALAGRTVANLSSDTPERTREAADWLTDRGARLLVGGVMVPAPLVGKDGAYVFYSGPRDVFEAHRETLARIGKPDYRGADPAVAQLYYQAQLDIFLTSLSAYLHATALVGSAGVSAREFLPYAVDNFDMVSSYLAEAAEHIDAGEYPGEKATALMMGATADHIVGASRSAGIDLDLPGAVKAHYDRAVAAGRGKDGWAGLFEVIRQPSE